MSYINIDDTYGNHRGTAGYNVPANGKIFWSLRQWGNIYSMLPATFQHSQPWAIAHRHTRIKFYPQLNGINNVYELAAAHVPCPSSGSTTEENELDLFLEPKDYRPVKIYLSDIGQLQMRIGASFPYSNASGSCRVNSTNMVASLVLQNDQTPAQTFFLQIDIGGTNAMGRNIVWCPDYEGAYPDKVNESYRYLFCAGDTITNYGGGSRLSAGEKRTFNIDILPRLQAIILSGHTKPTRPFGTTLNKNLRGWYISGFYFGIINYGGTNVSTQWWEPQIRSSGGTFCSGSVKTQWICEPPVTPNAGWVPVGSGCYHRVSAVPC